jgi:hypothetical protein
MRVAHLLGSLTALACASCASSPPWCQATEPLDSTCAGPHCVASVVVDYARLEPRGYRIYALSGTPIGRATAEARAVKYAEEVLKIRTPDLTDADQAGDFFNCYLNYSDGDPDRALVIIHAETGVVVFGGLEVWGQLERRGDDLPLPEGFHGPEALGCADSAAEPESKMLVKEELPGEPAAASTPGDAWNVARRLNLTADFTAGTTYRAMVVRYAPSIGNLDAQSADWYVWIYRP